MIPRAETNAGVTYRAKPSELWGVVVNRLLLAACIAGAALDAYEGFQRPGAWALLAALLAFSAGMRVMR